MLVPVHYEDEEDGNVVLRLENELKSSRTEAHREVQMTGEIS